MFYFEIVTNEKTFIDNFLHSLTILRIVLSTKCNSLNIYAKSIHLKLILKSFKDFYTKIKRRKNMKA